MTRTSGRAVSVTGADRALAAVDSVSAGVVACDAGTDVVGVTAACGTGVCPVLAGGSAVAVVSATALAMPIEATRPSIVERPMPAVAMRARCAGW